MLEKRETAAVDVSTESSALLQAPRNDTLADSICNTSLASRRRLSTTLLFVGRSSIIRLKLLGRDVRRNKNNAARLSAA